MALDGESAISVPLLVAGTARVDFVLASTAVEFLPGETLVPVVVTLVDDSVDGPAEQISLSLGQAQDVGIGPDDTATVIIEDDEATPVIEFEVAQFDLQEGDPDTTVVVLLSGASSEAVTVGLEVGGSMAPGLDYVALPNTIVVPAGDLEASVVLTVLDDVLHEASEDLLITLSEPIGVVLGAQSTFGATVLDNDAVPVVAFTVGSSSAGEGVVDPQVIEVTLSEVSGLAMSEFAVTGFAVTGVDTPWGARAAGDRGGSDECADPDHGAGRCVGRGG